MRPPRSTAIPRSRAPFTWALALLVLVFALGIARTARANEDDALNNLVESINSKEFVTNAAFRDARRKLLAGLQACKNQCSAPARARAQLAIAIIHVELAEMEDARATFAAALATDPNVRLPTKELSVETKKMYEEARVAAALADAPPAPTSPTPAPRPAETVSRGTTVWKDPKAFAAAAAGFAADQAGDYATCITKDKESIELEDESRTRLHLSTCEFRVQKLVDALRDAQRALEIGIEARDAEVMKTARVRVEDLLKVIPHLTFEPGPNLTELAVTFDERPVPNSSLTKRFSIDPGKHHAHAEGTANGIPVTFDQDFEVAPGDLLTVKLDNMTPRPGFITPGQLKCMASAKNQDEVNKCLPQHQKNLVVKAGIEFSGYSDSTHVSVASPSINAQIVSPTGGWNIGGSYLLDVVSAASPDIVSEASHPYKERRNAGTLTGGYKPGLYGVQATADVSSEPDYLSLSGGFAVSGDFDEKLVTPSLGFTYSHDTIGMRTLSFDTQSLSTSTIEGGVTLVLSPSTLLVLGATAELERGDQSKPYRFIPMFDAATASRIPDGATIDLVNATRLPFRAQEALPTERNRFAIAARLAHRLTTSTIRLEERLYQDSWALKASTTDLRYVVDAGSHVRVWPHLRFHAQSGVDFYKLAYAANIDPTTGALSLPSYRTDDRELSPLVTFTGGLGTRFQFGGLEAKSQYGLSLQGDIAYTQFFNALFITSRTSFYGSIAFDMEFE